MPELNLAEAQDRRKELLLDQTIDRKVDELHLSAKNVGPDARKKLKGILKHYAKKKHPFAACVRDNEKRFGKKGAERVCATLKDIIRGTTKWRKGGKHDKGTKLSEHLVDDAPYVPEDVLELIDKLTEEDLMEIYAAVEETV